jgi:hypothetical protein
VSSDIGETLLERAFSRSGGFVRFGSNSEGSDLHSGRLVPRQLVACIVKLNCRL